MVLLEGFVKESENPRRPNWSWRARDRGKLKDETKSSRIGSSFTNFLKEDGIYQEVTAHAIKRVLAWQIEQAMKAQHISKVEMAKRTKTSRAQLDLLLDPENDKVQLNTVQRAALAVGRTLHLELV